MAVPLIYLFNASANGIYVFTNGASPTQAITVPAASPANWIPQSPTTQPTFTNTPGAGTFGWGNNTVTVQVMGGSQTSAPFVINIPQNTQIQLFSVEIYLFYLNVNSVSWMVLGDGTPLSGSVAL
jgi:hypothetical protein